MWRHLRSLFDTVVDHVWKVSRGFVFGTVLLLVLFKDILYSMQYLILCCGVAVHLLELKVFFSGVVGLYEPSS